LDEQLSTSIAFLLRRGETIGQIVTSQLSFRAKINLFVSLFKHEASETEHSEQLRELAGLCGKAEGIRNRFIAEEFVRWLNVVYTLKRKARIQWILH